MYDPLADPPIRRRSATPAELSARRQGYTPQPTRTTREDNRVGVTPRSAVRHRPLGTQYVILMSDGSEMHVTEHELAELLPDYQRAARLLAPTNTSPRQRRQLPSRHEVEEPDEELPPSHTTERLPAKRRRRVVHLHWLVWVGGACSS